MLFGIFSVCAPPPCIQIQNTSHYKENHLHHVKILHVRLGGANNKCQLSWGGGQKRKRSVVWIAVAGNDETGTTDITFSQNHTGVTLYYTSDFNGHVCGIAFIPDGSVGCTTHGQTHTVDSEYTFAGFITLTSQNIASARNFFLLPIQTSKIDIGYLWT